MLVRLLWATTAILPSFIGSKLHIDRRRRAAPQPHPLVHLVIEAIDLADDVVSKATALKVDDSAMWLLESLSKANLGLRTGESVINGVKLQKYFQGGGGGNVQAVYRHGSMYARARASRLRLFDRVLATGHKDLIEQVAPIFDTKVFVVLLMLCA